MIHHLLAILIVSAPATQPQQAEAAPNRFESLRIIAGIGALAGPSTDATQYMTTGWPASLSVGGHVGVGLERIGELLVGYEHVQMFYSTPKPPLCGSFSAFTSRDTFSIAYRYNILGYRTLSPYVMVGPTLGWANYDGCNKSGCQGWGWSTEQAFSAGVKTGAGLSWNAARWIRITLALDYTVNWTMYPAKAGVGTAVRAGQYPLLGLYFDILATPYLSPPPPRPVYPADSQTKRTTIEPETFSY
ncbi:MAG: hypothetical protein WC889_08210 [Myxococcota bacterium]|jgi:hypothetical protein